MPRIAFKVFLLIVANVIYIVMSVLEDLYCKPRASKSTARLIDIIMFCLMVLVNGRILEG